MALLRQLWPLAQPLAAYESPVLRSASLMANWSAPLKNGFAAVLAAEVGLALGLALTLAVMLGLELAVVLALALLLEEAGGLAEPVLRLPVPALDGPLHAARAKVTTEMVRQAALLLLNARRLPLMCSLLGTP